MDRITLSGRLLNPVAIVSWEREGFDSRTWCMLLPLFIVFVGAWLAVAVFAFSLEIICRIKSTQYNETHCKWSCHEFKFFTKKKKNSGKLGTISSSLAAVHGSAAEVGVRTCVCVRVYVTMCNGGRANFSEEKERCWEGWILYEHHASEWRRALFRFCVLCEMLGYAKVLKSAARALVRLAVIDIFCCKNTA